MGTTREILQLLVDVDLKGGVHKVEEFGQAADKNFKKSQSSLDKWGSGLTKVGAGMIGFGAASLFGLGKMAMASEEADKATLKLQNSLRQNPRLAGENVKTYTDLATAIQSKTAADADDITAGIAVLAQGKLNARQMKELIPLVVDLARKKGMDETAAFTLASKAAGGNALALKKQGIAVDENLAKTDAYKATVEALRTSVGGFAEDEGKTFSGSLERLRNQLGDLEEGVGKGVVDAFTDMFGVVGGVTGKLDDLSPGLQATVGKVATYGSVALIAAGATSTLIGQVIKARENFALLGGTMSKIGSAAELGIPFAIATGAVLGLDAALDKLFPIDSTDLVRFENNLAHFARSGNVAGEMARVLGKDMDKLGEAFNEVVDTSTMDNLQHAAQTINSIGGLVGGDRRDLSEAKRLIDDLDKTLASIAQRNPAAAAAAYDRITETLQKQGISAKDVRGQLDDYNKVLVSLDTDKAVSGSKELTKAQSEQAEATTKADEALKEELDTLRAEFDPLFAMQDAVLDQAKAQQKLTEATQNQQKAQEAHTKAVARYGENSKTATARAAELAEADRDLAEATLSANKTTVDFSAATRTLSDKLANGSIKLGEARQQMYDMAIAAGFSKTQALNMAASFDVVAAKAKKVPPKVVTQVAAPGLTGVMQQLGEFVRKYADRTLKVKVQATAEKIGGINVGGGIRVFGTGGDLGPGEFGITGDAGPELIVGKPGGGAHIYNRDQLRSFGSGGGGRGALVGAGARGGDINVYVTVQGSIHSERDLVKVIRDEIQRGGMRGLLR